MTLEHKTLVFPTMIDDTAMTLYANPNGVTTYVKNILVHNTDGVARSVRIYFVVNATGAVGTASVDNEIFYANLDAYDTINITLNGGGLVLSSENDSIQAVADLNTSDEEVVNITITGATE